MRRIWLAVISASLATAILPALCGFISSVRILDEDMPEVWGAILLALPVGFLYRLFFLVPMYFLICHYFRKHRGFYLGTIVLLWLSISAFSFYGALAPTSDGAYMVEIGIPLLLFPAGVISAVVFALVMGKQSANSPSHDT